MTGIVLSGSRYWDDGSCRQWPAGLSFSLWLAVTSYTIVGIHRAFVLIVAGILSFLRRDPSSKWDRWPYGADERNESKICVWKRMVFPYKRQPILNNSGVLCAMFFCSLFCAYVIMVHIVIHAHRELGISTIRRPPIFVAIMGCTQYSWVGLWWVVFGDRIGNKLASYDYLCCDVSCFVSGWQWLWNVDDLCLCPAIFRGIAQAGGVSLTSRQ